MCGKFMVFTLENEFSLCTFTHAPVSSPLKIPGTIFCKSVSPKRQQSQEQRGGGNYDLLY